MRVATQAPSFVLLNPVQRTAEPIISRSPAIRCRHPIQRFVPNRAASLLGRAGAVVWEACTPCPRPPDETFAKATNEVYHMAQGLVCKAYSQASRTGPIRRSTARARILYRRLPARRCARVLRNVSQAATI